MLGYFDRGLIETLDEKKRSALLKRIPSGKLGRAEDVFKAVEFIIRTDYLNAATIRLDGGFA
jgi:NAD(P)-dependent dehydrogenase (short-subunit alcohol dehydrogenase family)